MELTEAEEQNRNEGAGRPRKDSPAGRRIESGPILPEARSSSIQKALGDGN